MQNFSYIRNKYEHLTLIPQTKKETKEFSIKNKKGGGIFAHNVTVKGNVSFNVDGKEIRIDESTQFPENSDSEDIEIERNIWVDFLFDGASISPEFPKEISVIPFLEVSLKNTIDIVQELERQ